MNVLIWLRRLIAGEPAIVAWITGGGALSLFAYWMHASRAWEAAAAVIVAGVATIWTAIWAQPPRVAVATGGLATLFTAMGVFGFHPSAHLIALAGSLLAILMTHIHRSHMSPWLPPAPAAAPAPPVT